MLSYTIYITGTRKFLPDEGKSNQRFKRDAYRDAVDHFQRRKSKTSPPSSSSSSSLQGDSMSEFLPSSSTTPSNPFDETPLPPIHGDGKVTGSHKAEFLHSHFFINVYDDEEKNLLDDLLLNPIIHVGEVVAGDEKLFHFTANHMNTKAIPQKKDVSDI
jgi:hypothetical protein